MMAYGNAPVLVGRRVGGHGDKERGREGNEGNGGEGRGGEGWEIESE